MLNLVDTLILGIDLPDAVVTAINHKIEQYYIAEEYKFRVAREVRESERKKIEAEGISEFQQIVSQGISDSYLRWRAIDATLQLSQSNNAKVVIVGRGKDGLPTILGNAERSPSSQSPSSVGSAAIAPGTKKDTSSTTFSFEQTPADSSSKPPHQTTSGEQAREQPGN
jgi:hypothetical protein